MENQMQDKTEILNRMKEIFNGSVQEHIHKLIMDEYKLMDGEIRKYFAHFDKYFPKFTQVKFYIVLMIKKLIKELYEQVIKIRIEGL